MTLPHLVVDARLMGHSGIGRYITGILTEWLTCPPSWRWQPLLSAPDARFAQGVPVPQGPYSVAGQIAARKWPKSAVHWTPHWNHPMIFPPGRKHVVTVHDLIPLRLTDIYSRRDRFIFGLFLKTAVKRGYRIITGSEFSKSEILTFHPKADVTVIPYGQTRLPDPGPDTQPVVSRPYLLAVGNIKPHKNLLFAIRAFQLAKSRRTIAPEALLVVAGSSSGLSGLDTEFQLAVRAAPEDVVWIRSPDDITLARLYAHAQGFVAPSLYEGFGLPILEAVQARLPIACSSIGPFHEILGAGSTWAVRFFDPRDIDSAAAQMAHLLAKTPATVLHDPALLQPYCWKTAAQRHIDVLS